MDDDDDDGGGGEGAPAWMATFADLMSLLLTFFVLLLSFANMDIQNFQMALGSVREALGVKTRNPGYLKALTTSPVEWESEADHKSAQLADNSIFKQIDAIVKLREMQDRVKLEITEKTIVLRVYGLFPPGSAELAPTKFEELRLMVEVCNLFEQPVRVEAHTDDRPIRTERFSSNWELSAVRAGTVARFLAESGVESRRLSAGGYASLRPLGTNGTAAGRALNRRVALVIAKKRDVDAQITNSDSWK